MDCLMIYMYGIIAYIALTIVIYYYFIGLFKNRKIPSLPVEKFGENVVIPLKSKEKQHGDAWFVPEEDFERHFKKSELLNEDGEIEVGGIVFHVKKGEEIKDTVYTVDDDIHTLILGATRSGKTRGLILQLIINQAMAGENIICSDPKGELFLYTYPFLNKKGYNVLTINLKEPLKSHHYNYMNDINQAIEKGDMNSAQKLTSTLVNILKPKQEKESDPFWRNGEVSVLNTTILTIAKYASPECKNLYNVFLFIAQMAEYVYPSKANSPIYGGEFYKRLPVGDPLRTVFAVVNNEKDDYKKPSFPQR
ncbi:hypothetical protein AZF37_07275 [endosymbiont 'TC1' of Trimyema compressum]|uniref:type IV secretory system conjugative DNA transfer family protein n=1 Tax=endosymbiont 'TC1' of Trimyema compressum TaxID=243899 RepID=UPI0007F0BF01|nr:type IV secretory system conjugative DNA transfer family protein [endosymbiont 'TC1' of Trimyema compressum]AMP20988.1 hypothetical protein AZF37_07275 [endosymbiont 'TC1' of Trimyema compressum]